MIPFPKMHMVHSSPFHSYLHHPLHHHHRRHHHCYFDPWGISNKISYQFVVYFFSISHLYYHYHLVPHFLDPSLVIPVMSYRRLVCRVSYTTFPFVYSVRGIVHSVPVRLGRSPWRLIISYVWDRHDTNYDYFVSNDDTIHFLGDDWTCPLDHTIHPVFLHQKITATTTTTTTEELVLICDRIGKSNMSTDGGRTSTFGSTICSSTTTT